MNDLIYNHQIDIFCLTETWLQQEDHVSINESTPSDYLNVHVPRTTGRGGGVALLDYTASEKNFTYRRCLSENAVTRFKELISSSLSSLPCVDMTEDSYLNFTPALLDYLVDSTIVSMSTTLDNVAPQKRKAISQKRLAPWYNSQRL